MIGEYDAGVEGAEEVEDRGVLEDGDSGVDISLIFEVDEMSFDGELEDGCWCQEVDFAGLPSANEEEVGEVLSGDVRVCFRWN